MASDSLRFLDQNDVLVQSPLNVTCVLDKERSLKQYVAYMLDRTNRMFEYDGLPETIPARMLELYLQVFGYAAFVKIDNGSPILYPAKTTTPAGVYVFFGGIGGERDIYYRPKLFTLANPRLKSPYACTIMYDEHDVANADNPCVLMPNDTNYCGLLPLFNRYAAQLVENDISIRSAQINARAQSAIEATTDRDKEQARKYLDDLEAGKMAVIGESAFLDGIRVSNVSTQSSNTIIQLIELQQYLKASWYNELGLNVNFNMKREYMSEEEIAVNTDILLPLVDDMLERRQWACELINKVFGLNISVRKSSAWANKEQEELAALSEASAQGGIGLKETIADKIEGGSVNAEQSSVDSTPANVQEEVPERPEEVNDDNGRENGDSSAEDGSASGDESEVSADVNINVNVTVEEVSSDESDASESETSEESEEPASE